MPTRASAAQRDDASVEPLNIRSRLEIHPWRLREEQGHVPGDGEGRNAARQEFKARRGDHRPPQCEDSHRTQSKAAVSHASAVSS